MALTAARCAWIRCLHSPTGDESLVEVVDFLRRIMLQPEDHMPSDAYENVPPGCVYGRGEGQACMDDGVVDW